MKIESIVCPEYIEEKLQVKHGITRHEAEQVLHNFPRFRFVEKGHTVGENVYVAFGQTIEGRYLSVFFIYKPEARTAIIVSTRDMSRKERKAYERK
jgi:uncharacterized DUF497 family protein